LIVPVIHRADKLSLEEIAYRRDDLVKSANTGGLQPDDIQGGTFTITNLGMYGIDVFNAIINPPEAAILAVGRILERVIPVDGQPSIQPVMMLSLSCDHRVVDGARGAEFIQTLVGLMEEPLALLL
jgi:pyruvate dehydrogenase E2 component (dihydrolipoamide acetyltransferase)